MRQDSTIYKLKNTQPVRDSCISPLLLGPMAAYNGEVPDSLPSSNYMELPNEDIDKLIQKNYNFIAANLRVYDLITGPHIFNSIIPDHVLKELKLKDPKSKIQNARKFLNEYLKSDFPGKGKVLKDALLMRGACKDDTISSDHKLIWKALSSRTQDTHLEEHSQEKFLIDNVLNKLKISIGCDEDWLSDCLQRELITRDEMEEIRACRNANGDYIGNVLLLDCITKSHQFLNKFLKLLWSRELKHLVQEIDSVQFEKFQANERTSSDAITMNQEIDYMSGPVPEDDYQYHDLNEDRMQDCNSSENTSVKMYSKKDINLNIPINYLSNGSVSSIALNNLCDRSMSSIELNNLCDSSMSSIALSNPTGFSSPTLTEECYSDDEGISSSVNQNISGINRTRTKVPNRKTSQLGFQSPNTTASTHENSNIFVDKKKVDKLSDYTSNSTKPPPFKNKSIKPLDQHETKKTSSKTSDNFKASPENKTHELTKSAKTQEEKIIKLKIHTDLSENTTTVTPKPHSETLKPQYQIPPNKLRTQASNGKKPSRMQEHVERASQSLGDPRKSSATQGALGKSTRSLDSSSSQQVQFYPCPSCKTKFNSSANLREHIKKTCGPKGDDLLRCTKCKKMFNEKATLSRHRSECNAGGELTSRQDNTSVHRPSQVYSCSQCNSKFMEKEKLKNHRSKHGHV